MSTSANFVIKRIVGLLAAGLATLVLIVGMTIWLGERAQALFNDVVEARDISSAAVELRNALQTAESSQRGYLATSNEIYLAPYGRAKSQALRQRETLQRTRLRSDSRDLLERLTGVIESKVAEMDRTIDLKAAHQDEDALALLRTNRGKALMDEADVYLSGIVRAADERQTSAAQEQHRNSALLRIVSIVGGTVIILVVGIAVLTVHRYTREVTAARDQIRAINDTLEQRVSQRTTDLAKARDRAETLLAEVNHRVANSLALVASFVRLQSKAVKDEAAQLALVETQSRIDAVSIVHKRLYASGNVEFVALDAYLSGLLDHLQNSMNTQDPALTIRCDLEPLTISVDQTVNLGVVLAEWVTNAFKYAYPNKSGEVRVTLRAIERGRAELRVEDDGVGRGSGDLIKGTGLGARIVAAMASTMSGEAEYVDRAPGTAARLIFPLRPTGNATRPSALRTSDVVSFS